MSEEKGRAQAVAPGLRARSALAGPTVLLPLLLTVACAAGRPAVIGPAQDPAGVAGQMERETALSEPLRIDFEWSLNEARQRHRGVGVARIAPPYRARLDLFTEDLETVLSAVLDDGVLQLPPDSRDDILPPTDLMWGTLGIIRPHDVQLLGAEHMEGDALRLRYAYPDGSELHYFVAEGIARSLELLEGGHVVQRVDLEMAGQLRYPAEATYRNLTAFRELTIVRRSLTAVPMFDPEIWDLAQ